MEEEHIARTTDANMPGVSYPFLVYDGEGEARFVEDLRSAEAWIARQITERGWPLDAQVVKELSHAILLEVLKRFHPSRLVHDRYRRPFLESLWYELKTIPVTDEPPQIKRRFYKWSEGALVKEILQWFDEQRFTPRG